MNFELEDENMSKILAACFSASGTTARLAQNIAETLGGKLLRVTAGKAEIESLLR